ncbi:MAG: sigma 54-interacting transcriptional regulator [Planctomycetes bacterium]|nr:sigma 54-interacting transcriptional regulator [Planctomycetota bacterium]
MPAEKPKKKDLRAFLRDSILGGGEEARERERLVRIIEIIHAMASEQQPKRILATILDAVIELTSAERGFLILRRGAGQGQVEVARNLDREAVRSPEFKISHTIAEQVIGSGEDVLTDSATDDPLLGKLASVAGMQLRSILCVPLRFKGETLGCVYIDHRFKRGSFTESDRKLARLLADQAAVAVENARLHAENEAQRRTLEELNKQLEERVKEQEVELRDAREKLARAALPPPKYDYSEIVGRSSAMREVFRLMDIVTDTEYPVLILGESGTGKELVARAIVRHGSRADRPFLSENCAALAESLLESELFGYVKGAFTGATSDRVGLFEQADGGTLFLDEIGDMTMPLQRKLLRVLQEGEFRKVGATQPTRVDVRIIAATNADLGRMAEQGAFREDLYYRLKVITIRLPPLRERRDDIPLLVEHILARIARETQQEMRRVTPAALKGLVAYHWPGNVRELENELRRMTALAADSTIESHLVTPLLDARRPVHGGDSTFAGRTMEDIEKSAILAAIQRCGGRRSDAAKALGMPRRTFYNRLRKYGIL